MTDERSIDVLPRNRALDGLRGIAIAVVLGHNLDLLQEPESRAAALLGMVFDRGWIGVQLFFVLSGFLITAILLRTREASNYFRAFYARRVLRIFPLYYATLIALLVVVPLFQPGAPSAWGGEGGSIWLWFFLSNWHDARGGDAVPGLGPFWSLAVEEQFYLVWPLLVYVAGARGTLVVSAVLVAVAMLLRALVHATGSPPEIAYFSTFCRMDALAIGAAIAAAREMGGAGPRLEPNRRDAWLLVGAVAAGGLVSGGFARLGAAGQIVGYTCLALGSGLLIVECVRRDPLWPRLVRLLRWQPLTFLGDHSYAMYVLHMPIHLRLGVPLLERLGALPVRGLWVDLAYVTALSAATLGAAMVTRRLIERPALRLKKYFVPDRGVADEGPGGRPHVVAGA